MDNRIIIIGQGYTGRLSIVRSVAALGSEITLIALMPKYEFCAKKRIKPVDAYSKYVSRMFYAVNYDEAMLMDILLNKCADPLHKAFVFPDNDFSAAAIDNNRDSLKEFYFLPSIQERQGAVEFWMDKVRQKMLAERVGLKVADYATIEVKDRAFEIPDSINYPCFAKPMLSISGGKSGLRKCDSKEELRHHIEMVSSNRPNVRILVEEYIRIDKEYATLGFSDGEEVVIPGVLELLHIAHGNHYGVCMQGKAYSIDGYEDTIAKFKAIVKEIGFVGIFDFDFFESDRMLYFCELNLRFGGSGYVFTKLGVNLPIMMIKYFSGESIDGMKTSIDSSATFFNERMAIDDWYAGYISRKELLTFRASSDVLFVKDEKDPGPARALGRQLCLMMIKKTIKSWLRKK